MYKLKTTETDNDVIEFIESVESTSKKEDTYKLVDIFSTISGYPPKMWGPSIIGFGSYHYKYATGHEGDAPIVGFSPRKANLSLYLTTDEVIRAHYLHELGKHKAGKSCVYINKLADIKEDILKEFIEESVTHTKEIYQEN